jgi:hypothetical protein
MTAEAIIALITLVVNSGLAEKVINLLIKLFDSLSADLQKQVAEKAASIAINKVIS